MKRLIQLSLTALLCALPSHAKDFEYTYAGQTLTYTVIDEDTKTCQTKVGDQWTGGNQISGHLVIPEVADGYTVTAIGDYAFRGCYDLISIELPQSVNYIGFAAFNNCKSLTSAIIPDGVTYIGDQAFASCGNLTSVELPTALTYLGNQAFYFCESLKTLDIPDGITSIEEWTFAHCYKLTSINLPPTLTSISASAFTATTGLRSITSKALIPPSCAKEAFNDYIFSNATLYVPSKALEAYKTAPEWKNFANLSYIRTGEFWDYVDEILYEFHPATQTASVARQDSEDWWGPITITIPEQIECHGQNYTVTSIVSSAFNSCSSLTSIEIPNSVTSIGANAFSYCSSLTSIEIPNSVTYIGSSAFSYCSSLTSIEIPNSVTYIGSSAFEYCSRLTSIEIPNSVTSIDSWAFYNCSSLTSIEIPNSVTSIGSSAFYNCSSLTSIEIPNSVTSISSSAFENCSRLTSIEIPNSVTSIGANAFENCHVLTSVTVWAITPPAIENNTFSYIPSDATLYVPREAIYAYKSADYWQDFKTIDDIRKPYFIANGLRYNFESSNMTAVVTYADVNSLSNYEGQFTILVPETVEFEGESYKVIAIGDEAFNNCWGLKAIVLPSTLQTIGKLAFGYCTSLRSVTIPDEVTLIDNEAFTGCSALASVEIGSSVETIGDFAFFGCTGLASLHVPESVKTIGDNAFMGIHWINEVHAKAAEPADAPTSAFSTNAYRSATLVVPDGAVDTYKAHPTWSNFMEIRQASDTPTRIEVVDGTLVVKGSGEVRVYNAAGSQVYCGPAGRISLPAGIYVVATDSLTKKVHI